MYSTFLSESCHRFNVPTRQLLSLTGLARGRSMYTTFLSESCHRFNIPTRQLLSLTGYSKGKVDVFNIRTRELPSLVTSGLSFSSFQALAAG